MKTYFSQIFTLGHRCARFSVSRLTKFGEKILSNTNKNPYHCSYCYELVWQAFEQKSLVRGNPKHQTESHYHNYLQELYQNFYLKWQAFDEWWKAGLGKLLFAKWLKLTKFALSKMPKSAFVLTMTFHLEIHVCKRSSAKHSIISYSFKSFQARFEYSDILK